ncbi:MAG: ABC transporter permease subunit [Nitrospiraceae bacterium]|nr:MAG: ABC transporter permease subunit [Nitrospiraceae bacterium]
MATLFTPLAVSGEESVTVTVGSKKFTESVILGEIVSHLAEDKALKPVHRRELGGTRVLWSALLKGEIDIYPEYTGTISREIFAGLGIENEEEIRRALSEKGIRMTGPLGFNNTYVIGMRADVARKLGIRKISDLRNHPELSLGFGNEFMDRGDGWPSLKERYSLPQKDVRGMDHDLAYRGLQSGDIDAMDLYATDAEIQYYKLQTLTDDLSHFPEYNALILYRADLEARAPGIISALSRLEGLISEPEMILMNARAKLDRIPESKIAADFLAARLSLDAEAHGETVMSRFWQHTYEHLFLVCISLIAAIGVSIPLGIIAAKKTKLGQIILGFVGIIQTIPSLALLVFMIPLLGIGGPPAIAALFLYSLLPIVRNTYTGIHDIPLHIRESSEAIGLSAGARLRIVEVPMASSSILAGIKTSAVINVGTATLGALIGAGGYGQPILTGIRLDDVGLILQGALPAALLALFVQGAFEIAERMLVPRGLRLKSMA